MSRVQDIAFLVARQALETAVPEAEETPEPCGAGNDYDGRIGLRISALFVILIGSMLGTPSNSSEQA